MKAISIDSAETIIDAMGLFRFFPPPPADYPPPPPAEIIPPPQSKL